MTKQTLPRRYAEQEFASMKACIKPVERWTAHEHKAWTANQGGFRHFDASNITPLAGC